MLRRTWAILLLATSGSIACDGRDSARRPDSPVGTEPVATPASRSWQGAWSPELGDLLVVPSDSELALIVYPDNPAAEAIAAAPVTLLNPAGDTIALRATLELDDTLQCGDALVARLAARAPTGWSVGLRNASAAPIRSDSIEALSASDSARAVADIVRLGSALTAKTTSRFTGLPFAVLGARRFAIGSAQVLAAHLVRRLPQEAAPLEEHTFIIAERRNAESPHVTVFSAQSHGSEETAQYFDAIALARAGDATFLILARDATSRTEYQILERSKAGVWRVRWTRPLSC